MASSQRAFSSGKLKRASVSSAILLQVYLSALFPCDLELSTSAQEARLIRAHGSGSERAAGRQCGGPQNKQCWIKIPGQRYLHNPSAPRHPSSLVLSGLSAFLFPHTGTLPHSPPTLFLYPPAPASPIRNPLLSPFPPPCLLVRFSTLLEKEFGAHYAFNWPVLGVFQIQRWLSASVPLLHWDGFLENDYINISDLYSCSSTSYSPYLLSLNSDLPSIAGCVFLFAF
ncbi:hypothetical protein C8R45DRAFT_1115494 [Mycena sanguinolenta]|nr:hypothetical protein C8R45DRAFT_1115494 [Mycena sanguinolenta]